MEHVFPGKFEKQKRLIVPHDALCFPCKERCMDIAGMVHGDREVMQVWFASKVEPGKIQKLSISQKGVVGRG